MVNMLTASIAMPKSCDVQVRRDFFHGNCPEYTTGAPIGAVIVGRFEWRGVTAEDDVQETPGFPGLSDCLADRKCLCVFL